MKKITLLVELTYDDESMHSDDEIGDTIGEIYVTQIEGL